MPLLIGLMLLAFSFGLHAFGETPFTVPRSEVVELVEPKTERIYPIFVKLPPSYNRNPEKHYPVVYLTDAPYAFQVVSGATRYPINAGQMAEFIIVGISYSKGSRGPSSRIRDFTPVHDKSWKRKTGNAQGHLEFFKKTLLPYIDENYRTQTDDRTYVGNSLGGLFGAYIVNKAPELFKSYILGSPSVWFGDEYILNQPLRKLSESTRIYISVGELETPSHGQIHDMVDGARKLTKRFSGSKRDVKLSIIPEATHATAFPTTAIQGLNWLYGIKKS